MKKSKIELPKDYLKVKRISVHHLNKEFIRIWKKMEEYENMLIDAGLIKKEITDEEADNRIEEFEQVKAKAESLGIQVRSNSKIETLKQKIAEKENA